MVSHPVSVACIELNMGLPLKQRLDIVCSNTFLANTQERCGGVFSSVLRSAFSVDTQSVRERLKRAQRPQPNPQHQSTPGSQLQQ